MSTAYKCDFCDNLFDSVALTQTFQFQGKSLEVVVEVKEAQKNSEFDVCNTCFQSIMDRFVSDQKVTIDKDQ